MTEDAATRLRKAAALIRKHAGDATPGPWVAVESIEGGDPRVVGGGHSQPCSRGDAPWIALMHPGIGEALATVFTAWAWMAEYDPVQLHRVGGPETVALAEEILRGVAP